MLSILHISNTKIDSDSRILKEITTLSELAKIYIVGVPVGDISRYVHIDNSCCLGLHLASRSLKVFPRAIRYFFEIIEFTVKSTIFGYRVKPQVIHCHDTFALPSGWLLSKLLDCKLVYDAHELESNKNGQNTLLSKSTLLIEKICWRQIDLLISVSQSIISWYDENLGSKEHLLVLNSPVFESPNHKMNKSVESKGYFRQLYNIAGDKPVFIYVGILGKGRGIEMCLDAFTDRSLDAHVVFLGYGPLSSLIVSYSELHVNIHLHPPVPHEQVVPLVQNADMGLCLVENISLSDYYCLPNKLFEYCFAGVPVLASNFPEISRVVEEYRLGMCCEPESQSIREAIRIVANNPLPGIVSDMSELSWSTQAERLKQAYQSLLAVT